MENKARLLWVCLCLGSLLLAGCLPEAAAPSPTVPPQAVYTAAAQTAQARMTENAAVTATQPPATASPTIEPTQALTVTSTAPLTTTLTTTPTVQTGGEDKLDFVMDVTVPDGTSFQPGATFVKTWRLKNTGTSTWTTAYELVFSSGEQMGAPASVPLTTTTPPGQTADVSVSLTAPQSAGSYFGFWMLRSPSGKLFGLPPAGDQPFYVQITVGGSGSVATPGASGSTVSDVALAADNANVEGSCPHIFYFVGRFVLNKASTVTYQLEGETGYDLTLPAPTTVALDAGAHTVTYTLEFPVSVEGWARFHVTGPDDVQSGQVNFTLQCD